MSFDISKFLDGLQQAADKQRKAAANAAEQFAEQVLADAQELTPVSPTSKTHPLYTGTSGALRDSGTVGEAVVEADSITVQIGFNTKYAAAVHERMDVNHQYPGAVNEKAQAKFLSTAIEARREQFGPFVANAVEGVK